MVEIKLAKKHEAELQALRQNPKINHASKEMALQKNSGIPIYKRFYKELQIKEEKINELKRSFALKKEMDNELNSRSHSFAKSRSVSRTELYRTSKSPQAISANVKK
jgi:hypothetical protein